MDASINNNQHVPPQLLLPFLSQEAKHTTYNNITPVDERWQSLLLDIDRLVLTPSRQQQQQQQNQTDVLDQDIIDRAKQQHAMDFQTAVKASSSSLLVMETIPIPQKEQNIESNTNSKNGPLLLPPPPHIRYEWIFEKKIAAQSLDPIFNRTEIQMIRTVAEALWQQQRQQNLDSETATKSRFTYQFPGNYEAHVSDFSKVLDKNNNGQNALAIINNALVHTIYPWVRDLFMESIPSSSSSSSSSFCSSNSSLTQQQQQHQQLFVYDALMIRYNASAISDSAIIAAAGQQQQPLHRDLGWVSVNIMLNDDFHKGGTYFEHQASSSYPDKEKEDDDDWTTEPIRPRNGPGCGIAHYSNERHAGARTTLGVRDILVFFLSVKEPIPCILNAHLKQQITTLSLSVGVVGSELAYLVCRIRHYMLAIKMYPTDGEAFLYLGSALMDYVKLLRHHDSQRFVHESKVDDDSELEGFPHESILEQALACFQEASKRIPNDARVWNNWGIALVQFQEYTTTTSREPVEQYTKVVKTTYQNGIDLLCHASNAGCFVSDDMDKLCLNYGLFLAKQNDFDGACNVLQEPASKWLQHHQSTAGSPHHKIVEDAYRLQKWCQKRF